MAPRSAPETIITNNNRNHQNDNMNNNNNNNNNMSGGAAAAAGGMVVMVDPYSTGCVIAQEMMKRGYSIMAVWSFGFVDEMKTHIPLSVRDQLVYVAEVTEVQDDLEATVTLVRQTAAATNKGDIVACLAGGEAGVDLADRLSEALGEPILSNGTDIPNRRDKQVQQELIGQAGLRSTRQAGGAKWEDVEAFLKSETYPVVLKPVESAGSDGVKLCHSFQDAKDHFHLLMQKQMVNGGACPSVLCQEFLQGKEYVVDHVSRNGVHKTTMIWVYDKRSANGSKFVYFGFNPVDPTSEEAKILVPYVRSVLDIMGIAHGPTHAEVIITSTGPCLVEMNCRANGGDGSWRPLACALTGGYSQVEATVDAFLQPTEFDKVPDMPPSPFQAFGQEVKLVSYSHGRVLSTPGFDVVKCLPSFCFLESLVAPGSTVTYTVDLMTCIGSIVLIHPDPAVVQRDVEFIRYLEQIHGFFTYETKLETLKRPSAITYMQHPSPPAVVMPDENQTADEEEVDDRFGDGPTLIRHMSNDRPELGMMQMMSRRAMTTVDASKEVVVVVDPYSTGCCIVHEIQKRGYQILCLWTKGFADDMKSHVPLSCEGKLRYRSEVDECDTLAETAAALKEAAGPSLRIVACLTGGEAGVDLADALSEYLKVRTNGTTIPNRRDKKIQQELIAKAGLRSVKQAGSSEFDDTIQHFLRTESYPVVLKPVESAGSDGVKLCHSFTEAKEHFDLLMKSQMVNGGLCPSVLCQEFLRGREYVVDHVSRDGIHKTVMVWVYDKRPANGSAFVYFGCVPVDPNSKEARILIPYVRRVLNALGVKNGPSHGEVMMTATGPCLVEMNCRAHGGDGNWRPLCRALTGGYSQIEASVDAYLDKAAFMELSDIPPSPFKASGQEVILVSFSRGTVKATPGLDRIQEMKSFVYLETGVKVGSKVEHTIDLFTGIGSVILMHHDPQVLAQDVETIRELERTNELFEYEPEAQLVKSLSKLSLAAVTTTTNDDGVVERSVLPTMVEGGDDEGQVSVHHPPKTHRRIESDRTDVLF